MKKTPITHWPAIAVIAFAIILGISSYQDYGISWDEDWQREIGMQYYTFVKGENPDFHYYLERDHGSGFELPLTYMEKWLNTDSSRDIFLMRHLTTHLFFLLGMFIAYIMTFKIFNNRWLATIALIALIFHPRIYAHSYFNSKDIPALSSYVMAMAAGLWALKKKELIPYTIFGIACGYAVSIRLMNAFILGPVLMFALVDVVSMLKQGQSIKKLLWCISISSVVFCVVLYVCWPTLWGHPVQNFIDAFVSLSKFRFDGNSLFSGSIIPADKTPWSYMITWISLTTPELWLMLGIIGIIILLAGLITEPLKYFTDECKRPFLLALICFLVPLVLVIVLNSVLYDGWRHMYFIYPSFIVLAMFGLDYLLRRKYKILLWGLCVLQIVQIGAFFIKSHPFEQVYFNSLISHEQGYLQENYELDYWGASNKDALEWILANNSLDNIKVFNLFNAKLNLKILPANKVKRLSFTDSLLEADYYIQHFRTKPYKNLNDVVPGAEIAHEINVLNSSIIRITKLK